MKKYFLLTMALLGFSSASLAGSQDYDYREDEEYEYNNFSTTVACTNVAATGADKYRFTFTIQTSNGGQNYENDNMAVYVNGKYYGMRTHEHPRTISTGLIYPHFARDSKTLKVMGGSLRGMSDELAYSFQPNRLSLVELEYDQFAFSGNLFVNQGGVIRMTCTVEGRLNFGLEK